MIRVDGETRRLQKIPSVRKVKKVKKVGGTKSERS
jgi:hypothetical protein